MFHERLKELVKESGLTQAELGKKLNISQQNLSRYMIKKTEPEYEILMRLAKYFDISIDYLLGVSDYRNVDEYLLNSNNTIDINNYLEGIEEKSKKEFITLIIDICKLYNSYNDKNPYTKMGSVFLKNVTNIKDNLIKGLISYNEYYSYILKCLNADTLNLIHEDEYMGEDYYQLINEKNKILNTLDSTMLSLNSCQAYIDFKDIEITGYKKP